MTVTVTHKKISTKPARTDNPTLVGSSDWNDTHTVTGLGDFVLGFATKAAVQAATMKGTPYTGDTPTTLGSVGSADL